MRKYGAWIGFILLLIFIIGQSVAIATGKDEVKINKEEVFQTIQKGYEAQYAIRGKQLSMEKMYERLSPYFTDNFLQVFTDENSNDTKTSGNHLLSKKPPFSFTNQTKLAYDKEHGLLYVYERVDEKGTLIYEIIILQQDKKKWKLAGYHANEKLLTEIQQLEKEQK
ncbi:DUF3993 domain-containing protein [Microbacteriaceae bacterium 4G12]